MDNRGQYIASFDAADANRAAPEPPNLRYLRREAITRFAELGFPTTRMEDWRFTSVAAIAERVFQPAGGASGNGKVSAAIARAAVGARWATRLVLVNGRYAPQLSSTEGLPPGTRVGSLREALVTDPGLVEKYLSRSARFQRQAFVALNTAFLEDGAFIQVPDGVVVKQPILVVFVSATDDGASVTHPRSLIVLGERSTATIVESYVTAGDGECFTNAVTELAVGSSATVEHYNVQAESDAALHVGTVAADQARDSAVSCHSLALGGRLVRNDVGALLAGTGAGCVLRGLYLVGGAQHVDNHTTIDHAEPRSTSEESYIGVLEGSARAVFSGRIVVRQDAQKIVARQTNRNLLLSKDAVVDTKPQLEIGADDVKCSHGATVGMLDADALFYLRSRGLDAAAARALLVYGFASEIVRGIKVSPLRDHLAARMLARLEQDVDVREVASS